MKSISDISFNSKVQQKMSFSNVSRNFINLYENNGYKPYNQDTLRIHMPEHLYLYTLVFPNLTHHAITGRKIPYTAFPLYSIPAVPINFLYEIQICVHPGLKNK